MGMGECESEKGGCIEEGRRNRGARRGREGEREKRVEEETERKENGRRKEGWREGGIEGRGGEGIKFME